MQGQSRLDPMMQTTIGLSRGLYLGCNRRLKAGEKRWTKVFGCGAENMKTMEPATMNQNENKDYQHSKPLLQSSSHN